MAPESLQVPALRALDHLIWVTPDLAAGIDDIAARLGVRPVPGGRHPGRGTHNALLGLGAGMYLEILAPDPTQSAPERPRWLGVDAVGPPQISSWAAKCADVPAAVAAAAARGVRLGAPLTGRRETADGLRLAWTLSDPDVVLAAGIVPFLIDWGAGPHPAARAPVGVTLRSLRAEHPDPEAVMRLLHTMGIALEVRAGPAPALVASCLTPRGIVELRGGGAAADAGWTPGARG